MPLGYDPQLLRTDGRNLANAVIFTEVRSWELDTPAQRAFLQAMATYSPEIQQPSQDMAVAGYVSTDLFCADCGSPGPARRGRPSSPRCAR